MRRAVAGRARRPRPPPLAVPAAPNVLATAGSATAALTSPCVRRFRRRPAHIQAAASRRWKQRCPVHRSARPASEAMRRSGSAVRVRWAGAGAGVPRRRLRRSGLDEGGQMPLLPRKRGPPAPLPLHRAASPIDRRLIRPTNPKRHVGRVMHPVMRRHAPTAPERRAPQTTETSAPTFPPSRRGHQKARRATPPTT